MAVLKREGKRMTLHIDPLHLEKAREALQEFGRVSPALLQRRLKISYEAAVRVIQELDKNVSVC